VPDSDDLGSLAQSARRTSLKNARRILFVLAGLQMIFGLFLLATAETVAKAEVAKEVKNMGGGVDPATIREAEAEWMTGVRLAAAFVGGLGIAFLILGVLVYKLPVAATVTALVLYVGAHLLDAAFDPAALFRGIILKVIVVVALVKAIQAAIAYERENKELAGQRGFDSL